LILMGSADPSVQSSLNSGLGDQGAPLPSSCRWASVLGVSVVVALFLLISVVFDVVITVHVSKFFLFFFGRTPPSVGAPCRGNSVGSSYSEPPEPLHTSELRSEGKKKVVPCSEVVEW